MPNLYREESSYPKPNAQRNLCGRTHYVDDDTLRFHKSRIVSTRIIAGGLLFAIVTSDPLNHEHTKRGFRFVIFDVFGNVVDRTEMERTFPTSRQAAKALDATIGTLDTTALTLAAIVNAEFWHAKDMNTLRASIEKDQGAQHA